MDYLSRPAPPNWGKNGGFNSGKTWLAWLTVLFDEEGFEGLLFRYFCESSICYDKLAILSSALCIVVCWLIKLSIVEVRLVTSWWYHISSKRNPFCVWLILSKIWLVLSLEQHGMSISFWLGQLPDVSGQFRAFTGRVHTSVQGLARPSFCLIEIN